MIEQPQCGIRNCKHLNMAPEPGDSIGLTKMTCRAFPDGIPERISYGPDLHLEVDSEQQGATVYELDPSLFDDVGG